MITAANIAELVPEQYAGYRVLVEEAIAFFLQQLDPHRLAEIADAQAAMPTEASLSDRVEVLLRHCPTLHKLGQVLARDRRLAPALRANLQQLETFQPTISITEIQQTVKRELGNDQPWELGDAAIAEASVAVVVPFSWRDESGTHEQGVFKILKPGVEERLEEELAIWSAMGAYLEERGRIHGLPELNYSDTLNSVQMHLRHEIQFESERTHLVEAARLYESAAEVKIPRVLPFCAARITAMERIHGTKVTDISGLSAHERRRLGATIIKTLIAKPFFANTPHAFFHSDPHAGNLFVDEQGRLVVLDWSLVSRLTKRHKRAIVATVLGALTMDEDRILRALEYLGLPQPHTAASFKLISDAMREVRWGRFPGVSWLVSLLDRLAVVSGMAFTSELTLFRKTLFTLTGVVADVTSDYSMDTVMMRSGLSQFWREIAPRMATLNLHDTFGTHVSNQELLLLWFGWPLTAQRYWLNTYQDLLHLPGDS